MRCFPLVIAAISMAFADVFAQNLIDSDSDTSPAPESIPSHNSASSIATADFGDIPPSDSIFVTPYDTGIFEASTSNPQDLETISSENPEESASDWNNAADTDILKSECSPDSIQTNGKFRRQQELCRPHHATNGLAPDSANQDGGDNPQAQSDLKDAAYASEHTGEDIDAKRICDLTSDRRKIPLCCRGAVWVSMGAGLIADCVAYIEGRPRCLGVRERYCCMKLVMERDRTITGINCRSMFVHL